MGNKPWIRKRWMFGGVDGGSIQSETPTSGQAETNTDGMSISAQWMRLTGSHRTN